ncbi:hypothetical protein [Serratia sp. FGI94]|uniref:hypothetical protein n=1 Tax=Serratia sp. FGI94 TaxID=671990 RepID=UPI00059C2E2E|nr:hypothetical protein [Serratia sp. FGI94]
MVRHYGFSANRKRGTLLPKVYDALEMMARKKPKRPGFAVLMKGFPDTAPYQCILSKGRLRFAVAVGGGNSLQKCPLTGCIGWRKNDGFRPRYWISAPEKWVLA